MLLMSFMVVMRCGRPSKTRFCDAEYIVTPCTGGEIMYLSMGPIMDGGDAHKTIERRGKSEGRLCKARDPELCGHRRACLEHGLESSPEGISASE